MTSSSASGSRSIAFTPFIRHLSFLLYFYNCLITLSKKSAPPARLLLFPLLVPDKEVLHVGLAALADVHLEPGQGLDQLAQLGEAEVAGVEVPLLAHQQVGHLAQGA